MSDQVVKVLHVAPGFLYGGIEKRLVDWYSLMDRTRIRFDIVKVTPDKPNPLVDRIREFGGNVYSIPSLGAKTMCAHFDQMRRIIQNGNYKVIHSHGLSYGYYPLKIGQRIGIEKRILHSRTTDHNPGERQIWIKELLAHRAMGYATDYFACSKEAGEFAFRGKHSFRVIDNGIFLEEYTFDHDKRQKKRRELGLDGSFVLGYVGRLSPPKNIPMLFEVFGRMYSSLPTTKLLVVGSIDDDKVVYEEAIRIASRYNALGNVIFAGRQDSITPWLNVMDVFLMPSHFEGFGTVAIEAQANGLPCLLSEAVPKSTCVSESVKYLPFEVGKWVEEVQLLRNKERHAGDIKRIADAGFDVRLTAKWLQDFYMA